MGATITVTQPIIDGVLVHAATVDAITSTAVVSGVGSGNNEIGAQAIAAGSTFGGVPGAAAAGTPALRPLTGPGAGPGRVISFTFAGQAQSGQIFGRWTADVAVTINSIELNAYAGGPSYVTGQALIGQVLVNGTPNAGTATLPVGTPYVKQAVTIAVAAGQTVDFQFSQVGTGIQPGNYVQMNLSISP